MRHGSDSFPGDRVLGRYAAADVEFVIVDRSAFPTAAVKGQESSLTLERDLPDPIGVDVDRLRRSDHVSD